MYKAEGVAGPALMHAALVFFVFFGGGLQGTLGEGGAGNTVRGRVFFG